jgi:GAF domain-containing protein
MSSLRQSPSANDDASATIAQDIAAIARIEAVPRLLKVLCETTGMGFAAVARVTDEQWVACAVEDRVSFGLTPGGELPVASTLCHDVRASDEAIFIDHASQDPVFCTHHTPRIYQIESYASVPIKLSDGEYFGNLCAIDAQPHKMREPKVIAMFELFAQLIALQLESDRQRERTESLLMDERQAASCASSSSPCWATTCATRWRPSRWARRCCSARRTTRPPSSPRRSASSAAPRACPA